MSDLSSFTNVFPAFPKGKDRVVKRTRRPVSCVTCRNRKTKCDRELPCGACKRRDSGQSCSFGPSGAPGGVSATTTTTTNTVASPTTSSSNNTSTDTETPTFGREEAQKRLARLEAIVKKEIDRRRKVAVASMAAAPRAPEAPEAPEAPGASEVPGVNENTTSEHLNPFGRTGGPGSISGGSGGNGGGGGGGGDPNGSLGTDANDSGYWTTFLEDLHGIQSYLDEEDVSLPDHSLLRLNCAPADPSRDMFLTPAPTDLSAALDDMLAKVPPREQCDPLLAVYFGSKFTAPTFLHVHQFRRRYEIFWEAPTAVNPLWLSMLFTILCTASFIRAARSGTAMPGVLDPPSKTFKDCAARCLILGRYLDAGPYSVEAVTLYAYSRRSCWADSDSLVWWLFTLAVRLAQRRKYDRDAPGLTPFQTEMRRRLWAYVDMCEMLASAQAGLPSIISDDLHVPFPRYLTDDDFDENTTELPPERPLSEPSTTALIYWKSRMTPIARHAVRLALSPTPPLPEQTWAAHAALQTWNRGLPPFMRWRPIRSTSFTDPIHLILSREVLEVSYRKYLCMLHRRCLTHGLVDRDCRRDARWAESRRICCESALITLDIHVELDRETQPGGRLDGERHLLSSLMLHDFLVAAMIICVDLNEIPAAESDVGGVGADADDRSRKLQALQTALAVWKDRKALMPASRDAAHATRVLGAILRKVMSTPQDASTESSPSSAPPLAQSFRSSSFETYRSPTATTASARTTNSSNSSGVVGSSPMPTNPMPTTTRSPGFYMFPPAFAPNIRGTALLPPESTTGFPACVPNEGPEVPDWVEIDQFLHANNAPEWPMFGQGMWFGA